MIIGLQVGLAYSVLYNTADERIPEGSIEGVAVAIFTKQDQIEGGTSGKCTVANDILRCA